jgi:uroporphyrinogen decarboxylase
MTGQERILTTLKIEEPDMVPTWDMIDSRVMDAILPGCSDLEFYDYMDVDAVFFDDRLHYWKYEIIDQSKGVLREPFGGISVRTEWGDWPVLTEPGIKSEKELDSLIIPDPDISEQYKYAEDLIKRFKGDKAIIASIAEAQGLLKEHLLGDVQFYEALYVNPGLIKRANEICFDYQLKYMKNCIDIGIDAFLIATDWAMNEGPLISPQHLSEFVAPYTKKMVEYAHSRGIPVIKHTDGNLWSIMEIILETGADALHPFDPIAGMDLEEGKTKLGNRICLAGNVDTANLLISGKPEEVQQSVKECIRKAGKGGGYICMSSNTIHAKVKPENYIAMVDAVRKYGQYPL